MNQRPKHIQITFDRGGIRIRIRIRIRCQMWRRLELLSDVLEMGFNVVLTDLDVIWFRDPFRHFSVNSDMTVSCDKWFPEEDLVSPNGGFWFARTNPRTREFFRFWLEDHSNRCPPSADVSTQACVMSAHGRMTSPLPPCQVAGDRG